MLAGWWQVLAIIGGAVTAVALGRLLVDWRHSDAVDVVLLVTAGLLDVIVGLSASTLDYVCTGGPQCIDGVQTYTGNYLFLFIYTPFGLICWLLSIVASIVTLGTVFKRRRQQF